MVAIPRKPLNKKLGIVISDAHVPFQDRRTVNMMLAFIREQRPATVHLLGDICDCYNISRFTKDPRRRLCLQTELDATREFLGRIRAAAGDATLIYSEGNHEYRLRHYLASEARALADLRSLRFGELLGFDTLDITWHEQEDPYNVGPLLFTHGQLVRKWSAATAAANIAKYGCCVICGHTHRLGASYHTDLGDTYGGWENGCLCDLNPEYTTTPDWQHGWSVVWSYQDHFHVEQVAVVKGRYSYHGNLFGRGRKAKPSGRIVKDYALV